jgi:hypothetical protein
MRHPVVLAGAEREREQSRAKENPKSNVSRAGGVIEIAIILTFGGASGIVMNDSTPSGNC